MPALPGRRPWWGDLPTQSGPSRLGLAPRPAAALRPCPTATVGGSHAASGRPPGQPQLQRQSVSLLEMPVYQDCFGSHPAVFFPCRESAPATGAPVRNRNGARGRAFPGPQPYPIGQRRERRWSSSCSGFSAELYSSYYACICLQTPSLPHCNIMCIYV